MSRLKFIKDVFESRQRAYIKSSFTQVKQLFTVAQTNDIKAFLIKSTSKKASL